METSEDARINYERANQIWTVDEKQDVTTQKLADLNKELTTGSGRSHQQGSRLSACAEREITTLFRPCGRARLFRTFSNSKAI